MAEIQPIFERLAKLTNDEGQCDFISILTENVNINENDLGRTYEIQKSFLWKIFNEIDHISRALKSDDNILISVKNQKLLQTCFQLITSLGFSRCLIPGLGVNLSKRCSLASILPPFNLNDEQKYDILVACTDFFTRSYSVPVLRNIIVTFHLTDYLAGLIQLSFAPLKKPGVYENFTMTEIMYKKFNIDKQIYIKIYKDLVVNCFQPILMQQLLVLQSVTDPPPPSFVNRVIAREMSQRLLASGGLLSLIRCFIESYNIDTGFEWKKIDMICKIITAKHGSESEDMYLQNICNQLKEILTMNNTHLTTAIACALSLNEKYPQSMRVSALIKDIFQTFDLESCNFKSSTPGTIILTPKEVEHQVEILHACVCTTKFELPISLLCTNLYIIFLLGIKCSRNDEMKIKLKDIILKYIEELSKTDLCLIITMFLFGKRDVSNIDIDEYDAGVAVKHTSNAVEYPKNDAMIYFLHILNSSTSAELIKCVFEVLLQNLIDLTVKRQEKANIDLLHAEEGPIILDEIDEQYANILQLLSELSTDPKVVSSFKNNPSIVLNFVEYFIKNYTNSNEECVTISLILLNTVLSNVDIDKLDRRFTDLVPILQIMALNNTHFDNILREEAITLILNKKVQKCESAYEKAISNVFDHLLPVTAHGIIELTKLIDAKDEETILKKHYIFCLFQEQLKDTDSYIYLSAINGIASLCTHCTEDVLDVLCKEFLHDSSERKCMKTKENEKEIAEVRMKIGDIIVKVTKRLGEMAIVHRTILLNTMLSVCRDEEPLIRASALSNLAEIALVLHYRIGSIIYEVLLCIWSIIESDKALECRRAAVMVISSLLKGLNNETLFQLKENLLPIYRTLKKIYSDTNEDTVVKLHAQIALEELDDIVKEFLFPKLKMHKQIFVLDEPEDIYK